MTPDKIAEELHRRMHSIRPGGTLSEVSYQDPQHGRINLLVADDGRLQALLILTPPRGIEQHVRRSGKENSLEELWAWVRETLSDILPPESPS